MTNFSSVIKDEISQQYLAGKSLRQLAAEFKRSPSSIKSIVTSRGVEMRASPPIRRIHTINAFAFSEITPSSAYWIGFLMADGNVRGGNEIRLHLAASDITHIEKLKQFVGFSGAIYTRHDGKYESSQISFCSKPMVADLARYGVTCNKTYTARATDERLEFNPDFWRGVIDGDGSLGMHGHYPYIYLIGSRPLVAQFKEFACSLCPCGGNVIPKRSVFCYRASGESGVTIIKALYGDNCEVALDRKKALAHTLLGRWEATARAAQGRLF